MPELPEVETVKRVLTEQIIGRKIISVSSNYEQMVELPFDIFKFQLIGKEFKSISRKGKYLIFHLDDINLISHLRMEGKFFYVHKSEPLNKHIHMVFGLDNDYELRYQDTRKFGRMVTKTSDDLYQTLPLIKLGLDANSLEIIPEVLLSKINNKKKTIKEVLLDQEVIAGLGNIYVDEVLALSKISPERLAKDISLEDVSNILASSRKILDDAIILKGTTIRSYTSSLGVSGAYQDKLLVHTKEVCPFCGNNILKIRVGGRGTYYCKNCQK